MQFVRHSPTYGHEQTTDFRQGGDSQQTLSLSVFHPWLNLFFLREPNNWFFSRR